MAEKRARRPPALLWLTLIALAALLAAPQTGWLVREQMRLQVQDAVLLRAAVAASSWNGWYPWSEPSAARLRFEEAAGDHPEDLSLQIALAMKVPVWRPGRPVPVAERVRALAERFGPSPELSAAILIAGALEAFDLGREESERNPEGLAAFHADAAAGEELEPDNAFFSFMRAAGLFAAGRDEEALAAVLRAGEKPRWDDYAAERRVGDARLQGLAFGSPSALPPASAVVTEMSPQYRGSLHVARRAVALAAAAERAGRLEEGLAIRSAVARVGARWRAGSRSRRGALGGIAITDLAAAQPGGVPLPYLEELAPASQRLAQHEAYLAYLREAGQAEEARWYAAEVAAGERVRAIVRATRPSAMLNRGHFRQLFRWWFVSCLLLASALVAFLLAGVGACLARARSPLGAGLGLAAALLALAFLVWRAPWLNALAPSVFALPQLHIGQGWLSLSKLAAGAAVLVYPLVALGVSAGVSLYRGDGRFHARLASSAGWTGLALLLLYALVLVGALRHEAAVQAGFERMLVHEGHYLADLAGMEWPE